MKTITVDYGYDVHSIDVEDGVFASILAGKKIIVLGQGFSHEEEGDLQDHWEFNLEPGQIRFWTEPGFADYHAAETVGDIVLQNSDSE